MARLDRPVDRAKPAKVRRLRLHGSIAHEIGVDIVAGRYRPGQLLAQEILASRTLKVSRTAYREAIRILAAKGLVESQPKTGTRISARRRWQLLDPEVLRWIFEAEPDERLIQGLFELRMVVEPAAAAFAAARRSELQLAEMRAALDEMASYGLAVEEGRLADRNFHITLLSATDNEMLATLSSGIAAAVQWTTVYKLRSRALPRDPLDDHARVFEAIRAGNPDAARIAMTDLIRGALEDIFDSRPKKLAAEQRRRLPPKSLSRGKTRTTKVRSRR